MKKFIIVKTQFESLHQWKSCPSDFSESYLKFPHRHIFFVVVKKEIKHLDRDIEFIDFKNKLNSFIQKNWNRNEVYENSCEEIAFKILKEFDAYSVQVFEDNENGSEVINA